MNFYFKFPHSRYLECHLFRQTNFSPVKIWIIRLAGDEQNWLANIGILGSMPTFKKHNWDLQCVLHYIPPPAFTSHHTEEKWPGIEKCVWSTLSNIITLAFPVGRDTAGRDHVKQYDRNMSMWPYGHWIQVHNGRKHGEQSASIRAD